VEKSGLYEAPWAYDIEQEGYAEDLAWYATLVEGRAFEVGCGTGRLAEVLMAKGVDWFGFDNAHAMVRALGQRHPDWAEAGRVRLGGHRAHQRAREGAPRDTAWRHGFPAGFPGFRVVRGEY